MGERDNSFKNRAINRLENARTAHTISDVAIKAESLGIVAACAVGADAVALFMLLLFSGSAGVNVITTPGMFRT